MNFIESRAQVKARAWGTITPLDGPVVPEVYIIACKSLNRTGTRGAADAFANRSVNRSAGARRDPSGASLVRTTTERRFGRFSSI